MTARSPAQEPEPTVTRDDPQPAPASEETAPVEPTGSVALRIVAGLAEMGRAEDDGAAANAERVDKTRACIARRRKALFTCAPAAEQRKENERVPACTPARALTKGLYRKDDG